MTMRKKPLDEEARKKLRELFAEWLGRMLRPNQRVRKPRKPRVPKLDQ